MLHLEKVAMLGLKVNIVLCYSSCHLTKLCFNKQTLGPRVHMEKAHCQN